MWTWVKQYSLCIALWHEQLTELKIYCAIAYVLKSSQSKEYGIGHNKNFNKLLKSVVNAKKHPEIGCMC